MSKKKIINSIHMFITEAHDCDSLHVKSVPLDLEFRGHHVWKGVVEVFDLVGHRHAKRCYAWTDHAENHGDRERIVTVLELPPVACPESAVKASLERHFKKAKK